MKHLFLTFVFLLCSYVVEAQKNTQAYNQAIKTLKIIEEDIDNGFSFKKRRRSRGNI